MKDPWKAVAEGGMGSQHPFLKHKIIAVSRADFSDIQDVWLLLFSHSVVSDSLWPHGRQAARLPCPLPSPGAYSNSCPSSQWCQPTISSSATPFSSCPQSCPASECFSSESFLCIKWPNYWSFSIHPSNEYSGLISFRIDWFDLLVVQGTLRSLLQYHSLKASILCCSAFLHLIK